MSGDDIEPLLREVTEVAVELIPGADHAGVTVVRRRICDIEVESRAATGPVPRSFDTLQVEQGEGPYYASIWMQHAVRIDDVLTDCRWPLLSSALREFTPIRSTHSVQLYVTDLEIGVLTVHSEQPDGLGVDTEEFAANLGVHAAMSLVGISRNARFRSALASQILIGQAKGMLMERHEVDDAAALTILRGWSLESKTPLVGVARQLVAVDPRIENR